MTLFLVLKQKYLNYINLSNNNNVNRISIYKEFLNLIADFEIFFTNTLHSFFSCSFNFNNEKTLSPKSYITYSDNFNDIIIIITLWIVVIILLYSRVWNVLYQSIICNYNVWNNWIVWCLSYFIIQISLENCWICFRWKTIRKSRFYFWFII